MSASRKSLRARYFQRYRQRYRRRNCQKSREKANSMKWERVSHRALSLSLSSYQDVKRIRSGARRDEGLSRAPTDFRERAPRRGHAGAPLMRAHLRHARLRRRTFTFKVQRPKFLEGERRERERSWSSVVSRVLSCGRVVVPAKRGGGTRALGVSAGVARTTLAFSASPCMTARRYCVKLSENHAEPTGRDSPLVFEDARVISRGRIVHISDSNTRSTCRF